MNTTKIKSGDIVYVEKKQGWKFLAFVEGKEGKDFSVEPCQKGPTFRTASSREITAHYRKTGA